MPDATDPPTDPAPAVAAAADASGDDGERLALLALLRVEGLGPTRVRALRRALGSADAAVRAAERGEPWPPLPRLGRAAAAALSTTVDRRGAQRELERAARVGARVVVESDADFPHAWATFDDLPPLLFVRGEWPTGFAAWPAPGVAIVGSRRASSSGRSFAAELGCALASAGAVVVSGLALGIDAAAHRGALEAPGGTTVAVLAGGVDRPSPQANAPLARAILDGGGALVSERPIGGRVDAHAFPRRNRLIAALSRAVLVVEAGPGSGANLTAGHANAYGRDVLVCPARPWDGAMAGNLALLRDGATPVCSVADALGLVGLEPAPATAETPALPPLAAPAAWAWELLGGGALTADEAVAASGRPANVVLAALERLTAVGVVTVDAARRYARPSARR